jgi:hypothetical protein
VPVDVPDTDLASGRPVRASAELAADPARRAVDEDTDTIWNSGSEAPGWIEIDLGRSRSVAEIRLLVAQAPSGRTVHRVEVRTRRGGPLRTIHTFAGRTADGDWLVHRPDEPITGVRSIRITTTQSPSWVAWREIMVTGVLSLPD